VHQYSDDDLVNEKALVLKEIYRQSFVKSGLNNWVNEDVLLNRLDKQTYELFDMQHYEQ
jgi:hypothetical protein